MMLKKYMTNPTMFHKSNINTLKISSTINNSTQETTRISKHTVCESNN